MSSSIYQVLTMLPALGIQWQEKTTKDKVPAYMEDYIIEMKLKINIWKGYFKIVLLQRKHI